jgi:hypothetical protein
MEYYIILNYNQFVTFLPYKRFYENVNVNYGYGYYTVILSGNDALKTKQFIERLTKPEVNLKRKRTFFKRGDTVEFYTSDYSKKIK